MSSPSDPPVSGSRPKGEAQLRGLPSIAQARQARRAAQPKMWTWLLLIVGGLLLARWKWEESKVDDRRTALLARQREVAGRLGRSWFSLRDRVERWTIECARDKLEEVKTERIVESWDFRSMPGIYLRLATKNAADAAKIRAAANKSLHDAFTSCLFTLNNPSPIEGERCETTQDCPRGKMCNEFRHCGDHSQPYNLRTAYHAMHVLSDEWIQDIQSVRNDLALRGAVQSFDAVEKYDLPVVNDVLSQAKYFLVVVDEPVEGGEPEPAPQKEADAGPPADDRSISSSPHPARVCLWRLEDGKKMLAIRRDAAGMLVGATPTNEETRLARQRQANACALAQEVRLAVGAQ
jgi:hypothetical protein